jgi:hypothetical protein
METKKEEQKEEFCSVCVAGVAALAGAGTAAGSSSTTRVNRKVMKGFFWIGIAVSIISIIVMLYFLRKGSCDICSKRK